MIKYLTIAILLLFGFTAGHSQENTEKYKLLKRIENSFASLETNPEKVNRQAQQFEQEGRSLKEPDAQLPALVVQCIYYRGKNFFPEQCRIAKNILSTANFIWQNSVILNSNF